MDLTPWRQLLRKHNPPLSAITMWERAAFSDEKVTPAEFIQTLIRKSGREDYYLVGQVLPQVGKLVEWAMFRVLQDEKKAAAAGIRVKVDYESILDTLNSQTRLESHLFRNTYAGVLHSSAFNVFGIQGDDGNINGKVLDVNFVHFPDNKVVVGPPMAAFGGL